MVFIDVSTYRYYTLIWIWPGRCNTSIRYYRLCTKYLSTHRFSCHSPDTWQQQILSNSYDCCSQDWWSQDQHLSPTNNYILGWPMRSLCAQQVNHIENIFPVLQMPKGHITGGHEKASKSNKSAYTLLSIFWFSDRISSEQLKCSDFWPNRFALPYAINYGIGCYIWLIYHSESTCLEFCS